MGIPMSGLGGKHLITFGYGGYISITPPIITPSGTIIPSRIEIIPYSMAKELIGLGILSSTSQIVSLEPLQLTKKGEEKIITEKLNIGVLNQVNIMLNELGITLQSSVERYLNLLSLIKSDEQNISLETLNMSAKNGEVYVLESLDLVKSITDSVLIVIPDIVKLKKWSELKKIAELLELLNEVSETE